MDLGSFKRAHPGRAKDKVRAPGVGSFKRAQTWLGYQFKLTTSKIWARLNEPTPGARPTRTGKDLGSFKRAHP